MADSLEARHIRLLRTAAVDLKAAVELEKRARAKRLNAARCQDDASKIERKLAERRK